MTIPSGFVGGGDVGFIVRLLWNYFHDMISWPSREEWRALVGVWEYFSCGVGCIDGTLHQINRPLSEPQALYY